MSELESSLASLSSDKDETTAQQEEENGGSAKSEALLEKGEDSTSETPVEAKPRPLGPFNEGVPTAFKRAIPSKFHRGILCQQPVTDIYEPLLDEDHLEIVSVMGVEIEDFASERSNQRLRKQNGALVTKQLQSRVNLPKLQFVNRDKKEINALLSIKSHPLLNKGSRNDLSDDEDADVHDFEVPFMDLGADPFSMKGRLTNTIKDGSVYSKDGALLCQDDRITPEWFLHCHICDKRGFVNLEHYDTHLNGDMHKTLTALHLEKLKAGLTYLRAGSKRAEVRLAMGLLRTSADPSPKMKSLCEVCGCNVYELRLHTQLPQHKIVEKFIFPECCGEKFSNRVEFDNHRCTLQHQRELFKERLALSHRLVEGHLKGEEDKQSLPEYLRLLKGGCITNDDDSTVNLTPYDPERPNVVKMLKYFGVVQCICCGDSFGREQLEGLYEHVHSIEHYEASVLYTTKRERSVIADIAKRRVEYPAAVRTHCRKIVKVADALVKDGHERAAHPAAGTHRTLTPPVQQHQTGGVHVALMDGEPVIVESMDGLLKQEDTEDTAQQDDETVFSQEDTEDTAQQDDETDLADLDEMMDQGEAYP